eukprot:9496465-Pyramimonas_sp.AAC.2
MLRMYTWGYGSIETRALRSLSSVYLTMAGVISHLPWLSSAYQTRPTDISLVLNSCWSLKKAEVIPQGRLHMLDAVYV